MSVPRVRVRVRALVTAILLISFIIRNVAITPDALP